MKKSILLLMAALIASINQTTVRADEVSQNEVAYEEPGTSDIIDSVQIDPISDLQSDEVLTGDVDEDPEENNTDDNTSDTDDRQFSDMVAMLEHDLVTYINFSYKMQICTVAMLAIIAGGNIAAVIINHFRS